MILLRWTIAIFIIVALISGAVGYWGWALFSMLVLILLAGVHERLSDLDKNIRKARGTKFSPQDFSTHGVPNSQMICPHCGKTGHILTKSISRKVGISGGKATGALLTGGVSLLAVGLSRKETAIEAHCKNCSSTWRF